MGLVVEKYDLPDGRRLELDAGPFYRNGVDVGACWFLMNRYNTICALDHEEIELLPCGCRKGGGTWCEVCY